MVTETDAIPYPGAVMIHPEDARLTNGAVMCPRGLDLLAFLAVLELS